MLMLMLMLASSSCICLRCSLRVEVLWAFRICPHGVGGGILMPGIIYATSMQHTVCTYVNGTRLYHKPSLSVVNQYTMCPNTTGAGGLIYRLVLGGHNKLFLCTLSGASKVDSCTTHSPHATVLVHVFASDLGLQRPY